MAGKVVSKSLPLGTPRESLGGHLSPKTREIFRTGHVRGLQKEMNKAIISISAGFGVPGLYKK